MTSGPPVVDDHPFAQPRLAHALRLASVPMLLFWIGLTVALNMFVPQLEKVGEAHTVSMSPADAPSMQAMKKVGKDFNEFESDSSAMVLLESDQPLGPDAHQLLRRPGQEAAGRHHPRRAHPGLLGGSTHGGRRAECRRQGRLRADLPRRQSG